MHNVPAQFESGVIDLCILLIEHQMFGMVLPDGRKIAMDTLPRGTTVHHGGDLDDPDFNNVHIEVPLGAQ